MDAEHGLIVNGHVPVKIEQGESPIKASGMAITIDGAFSEVYGDNGFTLVLDADRTYLAQHHHFESISEAITQGADIIPTIQDVCVFDPPRRVADTNEGETLAARDRRAGTAHPRLRGKHPAGAHRSGVRVAIRGQGGPMERTAYPPRLACAGMHPSKTNDQSPMSNLGH